VIADVDVDGGRATVEQIRETGATADFIETDISQATEVEALIQKTVQLHGRLDCACNNAAIFGEVISVTDITEEVWDQVLAVNLKGTWLCMKYEIPQMLGQGGGAIVNTTATVGLFVGGRYRSAYAASKAGIVSLTKTAALECAEHGVRINAICPGGARTPMLEKFFELNPEAEADFIAQAPMSRIAAPEEAAEGALWLCSDAASFVTGHVLTVEGGHLCR
jgi:NAD(P)-dependent dehydrogenase (short-subunit alcohol dehydrogenase family)